MDKAELLQNAVNSVYWPSVVGGYVVFDDIYRVVSDLRLAFVTRNILLTDVAELCLLCIDDLMRSEFSDDGIDWYLENASLMLKKVLYDK